MKKIIILFILVVLLAGCASFRRKFVREREKEKKPQPVVYFKEYTKDTSYDDLYKKHFLFWKYWEMELINALEEDNYKKQLTCIQQAISNLKDLETYLVSDKQKEVATYRENLEKIEFRIKSRVISELERLDLKRKVEKHFRMAVKELAYSKMKEFIKVPKSDED